MRLGGRAHVFGDNVTTDDIIAGKYKHSTMDLDFLASKAMENVRPGFAEQARPGDVVVGGANFGCGSSREQAPQVFRRLGVSAVLAKSFARIFFRNAVNTGLLLVTCDTTGIREATEVVVDTDVGVVELHGPEPRRIPLPRYPPEIAGIVEAGGLLAYVRANGGL